MKWTSKIKQPISVYYIFIVLLCILPDRSQAEIYQCTNDSGKSTFQDYPCNSSNVTSSRDTLKTKFHCLSKTQLPISTNQACEKVNLTYDIRMLYNKEVLEDWYRKAINEVFTLFIYRLTQTYSLSDTPPSLNLNIESAEQESRWQSYVEYCEDPNSSLNKLELAFSVINAIEDEKYVSTLYAQILQDIKLDLDITTLSRHLKSTPSISEYFEFLELKSKAKLINNPFGFLTESFSTHSINKISAINLSRKLGSVFNSNFQIKDYSGKCELSPKEYERMYSQLYSKKNKGVYSWLINKLGSHEKALRHKEEIALSLMNTKSIYNDYAYNSGVKWNNKLQSLDVRKYCSTVLDWVSPSYADNMLPNVAEITFMQGCTGYTNNTTAKFSVLLQERASNDGYDRGSELFAKAEKITTRSCSSGFDNNILFSHRLRQINNTRDDYISSCLTVQAEQSEILTDIFIRSDLLQAKYYGESISKRWIYNGKAEEIISNSICDSEVYTLASSLESIQGKDPSSFKNLIVSHCLDYTINFASKLKEQALKKGKSKGEELFEQGFNVTEGKCQIGFNQALLTNSDFSQLSSTRDEYLSSCLTVQIEHKNIINNIINMKDHSQAKHYGEIMARRFNNRLNNLTVTDHKILTCGEQVESLISPESSTTSTQNPSMKELIISHCQSYYSNIYAPKGTRQNTYRSSTIDSDAYEAGKRAKDALHNSGKPSQLDCIIGLAVVMDAAGKSDIDKKTTQSYVAGCSN
jgi:hypothetical protein